MKISYKFALIFIFIALMPSLFIGYLSYQKGKLIISNSIERHLFDENSKLLEMIDRIIQSRQQEVITLSENRVFREKEINLEEIKDELLLVKNKNSDYVSLSFFDMDRVRLVDTEDLEIGKKHDMVPYWEDVLFGKVSAGRDIRVAEDLKIPIIYFATSVHDISGKPFGVVAARYNPQKLLSLINSYENEEKEKEGTRVILINNEREVILSSDPFYENKVLTEKIFDLTAVRNLIDDKKEGVITEFYPPQGKVALITYIKEKGFYDFTGNEWGLIAVSDLEKSYADVTRFRDQIFTFSAFMIFISMLIGFIYGKLISKPIEKLTEIAQRISIGDLKQRADINTSDESGYLAKSFNQMLDNIEKSQNGLKEAEKKLESANQNLEEKVKERIYELEDLKNNLEKITTERTKELQNKVDELERFKELSVGRELKMIELKKEITNLKNNNH